ncbi:coiled-coil domain-containing protein 18-like isoform X2 [Bacillus rossius redtenbacheri]|uniref:coiled-coil domain-containing protein 18-like isoform X2 n=1 Tax=Bacillus rossius redtenbacheri TaxID=93214 RepID=UPI002FDCB57D
METWSDVILEWVNCLKFVNSAKSLKELEVGKFIQCFFTKTCKNYTSQEDVWEFMQKFFSSDCRVEGLGAEVAECRAGNQGSLVLLLSALLVHHCLEGRASEVLAATSSGLRERSQVAVKAVLEAVLVSRTPVTAASLRAAFAEATKTDHCLRTPLRTSTPKSGFSSPIVALLQSPLAQQQRDLSVKSKEIKRLRDELASEVQEKFEVLEQVEGAEKEIKALKSVLHQRDREIEKLKQDLVLAFQQSPRKTCQDDSREANLKDEIKRLEEEILDSCKEIGCLYDAKHALEEKVEECEAEMRLLSEEADRRKAENETLQGELKQLAELLAARTKQCDDLRDVMASSSTPRRCESSDDSFAFSHLSAGKPNSPENLGDAVVDVILQEKKEENVALSEKLDSLKAEKMELTRCLKAMEEDLKLERLEHQTARGKCTLLEGQVKQLEITVQEFEDKIQLVQSEFAAVCDKMIKEQHASQVQIESHKANVSDLTMTVENLNSKLEKVVSENAALVQKSSSYMEKITHLEKVVRISEENVKHLEDYVTQHESLTESQSLKISELLVEQSGYCQLIDCLKAQFTEVLIDKEHLQVLKESLVKSNDENVSKWSHDCEELSRKNKDLTSNLELMRNQLENVTLELAKKSEASNMAEKFYKTTIDDKELVIKTLADNKLLLEQSLAESEKERNTLQDCNVKLCEEMERVNGKLNKATEKYTALQNQLNELEFVKTSLDKALEVMEKEKFSALTDLSKLRDEISEFERSKIELEGAYNNCTLANEIELRKNNEKCTMLEKEVGHLEKEVEQLKLERADLAVKIASLETQAREMEKERVCVSETSEKQKIDLNDKICSLQDELVVKQNDLKMYIAELEDSKKQVANLEKCVSETVAAAKLNCDRVVSLTSSQVERFFRVLEGKFLALEGKLSLLAGSCYEDRLSSVLQARQLVLFEKEEKNEKLVKQVGEIKELCDKACKENVQLKKSFLDLKAKLNIKEQEIANLKKSAAPNQHMIEKAVRVEFEAKLDRAKAQMEKLMSEQAEKMKRSQMNERKALQDQISDLQNKYLKERKTSELFRSKCEMLKQTQDTRRRTASYSDQSKTTSREEVSFREKSKTRRDHLGVIQESFTYSRRRSTVPSETSPVFPMEDEEGELYSKTLEACDEVFSRDNLENLKAGRCELPDRHRLSELQYRNSLCPPHLKSSYPAETQFSAPTEFKEDDLKMGSAVDIDQSMRLLQSGERHRRKEKGQGCGHTTPRSVLREHNDSRRANTPSRIKEFFTSAFNLRDENTPVTPRSRRMSFFRKQAKN